MRERLRKRRFTRHAGCRLREAPEQAHATLGHDESVPLASLEAATSDANASIFTSHNYKICADFGLSPKFLSPVVYVYDTGYGTNLTYLDNVQADDRHAVRLVNISSLRPATSGDHLLGYYRTTA